MSNVIDVTDATFRTEVVESPGVTIVDFWAEWCGPCKKLSPILEEVAADFDGRVKVAKVNVDEQRTLAMINQIMSIPTIMVYADGQKVDEFQGLRSKQDLIDRIESHL